MANVQRVTILGGGLAGLSLGYWIRRSNPETQMRIIESRATYQQDRHWSFWHPRVFPPHLQPYRSCVAQTFQRYRLGEEVSSPGWSYSVMRSEDFYQYVLEELREELYLGRNFDSSKDLTEDKGHLIFDSRPPTVEGPVVWQQFYGWVLESKTLSEMECHIMDFIEDVGQSLVAFYYVLPLSENRVLLEPTVFTEQRLPRSWFLAQKQAWLAKADIAEYSVVEEESGCLPMSTQLYRGGGPYIPIGTRGGWLRASSGYAFERTQYFCRQMAQDIVSHQLSKQEYSLHLRWMDEVFLRVVRRYPKLVPSIIKAWSKKVPLERFLPFMQGEAKLTDALALILKTPHKTKFLRCCL